MVFTVPHIDRAQASDLKDIVALSQEFGHLMTYQQSAEGLEPYLHNISIKRDINGVLVGHYHVHSMMSQGDINFIVETKGIPRFLVESRSRYLWGRNRPLGIIMQGACHREVFVEFIEKYQTKFKELWCWCSIKSSRIQGYKDLGFSFNPKIEYTFFNPHVQRESTYTLGRWTSENETD